MKLNMVKESGLHEPDGLFALLKIADKYLKRFDSFDEFTINLTKDEHISGLFKYLKHPEIIISHSPRPNHFTNVKIPFDYILEYHNWLIKSGEDKLADFVENGSQEIEPTDLRCTLMFILCNLENFQKKEMGFRNL